ncbi:myotubularin-related protein 14-like [Rhipicephalus sanguineus]|uniref:myotubularin-related protein 14-like n=1 Tax=Rhipicephalus sanguineus TaxID=34632 RepID=UPI0020C4E6F7|nr:myotubularin-related protein 14-like [Rhipicephalus sanguineus]
MRMKKSRVARARTRFVVPVILYDGKHICRSATLSGGIEIYTRTLVDYLCGPSRCRFSQFCVSLGLVEPGSYGSPSTSRLREEYEELSDGADNTSPLPEFDASLHGELRKEDIELLRLLSVRQICDLMVEGKKEKYCLKMTSSEKVDRFKRYHDFTIFKLPYPGCEFFEKYVKQHYNPEGLFYDWTQHFVDVELEVPQTSVASALNIDWKNYKRWDLVELTKNYLKFLLKVVIDGDSSLLVHCISGWDRTALFISMLRLSLWADNKIHQNLSALEMAYLTAAYDWFLFSHNLPNRVQKFEEIFFFCFNMLKYISTDEFSTLSLKSSGDTSTESTGTSTASENESRDTHASCSGLHVPAADTTTTAHGTRKFDRTHAAPSVHGLEFDTSHDASVGSTSSSGISDASRDFSALAAHRRQCVSRRDEAFEEASLDVDVASVESLPLLRMSSQPQTGKLGDIHESWQIIKETGSTDTSLSSGADGDPNTSSSSIPGSRQENMFTSSGDHVCVYAMWYRE